MQIVKSDKRYTYADYLKWAEEDHYELIDGIPYMQAAPTWQHQAVVSMLIAQLNSHLSGGKCIAFGAPFDLRLPMNKDEDDKDVKNVLQPDITIVCDKNGLSKTGYYGVPSLIIEVVSPSTAKRDRVLKFNIYETAGVSEYWIVDLDGKYINVFTLQEDGRYGRPESYTEDDKVPVSVFPGFEVDLSPVFAVI